MNRVPWLLVLALSACRESPAAAPPTAAPSAAPTFLKWSALGDGAVDPARVRVDHDQKTITFSILVLGPQAGHALRTLRAQTAKEELPAPSAEASERVFLPVTLGEIRGYRPTFHLYGLTLDEALAPVVKDALSKVDGVILADVNSASADRLVAWVGGTSVDVPVAYVGDEAVFPRVTSATGRVPVFTGAVEENAWKGALKEVARAGLKALRSNP